MLSPRNALVLWLSWVLMLGLLAAAPAGEQRVALVIGNGAYSKVPQLPNPPHDAAAMTELLRSAGFVVEIKLDLGNDAMRQALRDFSEVVRDADVAVVFYAGHGMELNGVNYLVPTDATIARDIDVEDEAVSLDRVIRTLEPARRLQLVILDSCRDNPFVRSMKRTIRTRSVLRGLAEIDEKSLPPNTLVAYAQKAEATAEDGEGPNSPYTTALLKHLMTPGLDVELALRRVRDEVLKATHNRQEPFKYGSLGGSELPLAPSLAAAPGPPASPAQSNQQTSEATGAAGAWTLVQNSEDIAAIEAFRKQFGAANPFYDQLATSRIGMLTHKNKRQETTMLAEPTPAAPPVSQADVEQGAQALDAKFQQIPMWLVVKREFPDWYSEHLKEVATLSAQKQPQLAIDNHLAEALVSLRRQHAQEALLASTDKLKVVASAFLDNVKSLSKRGVGACFAFISQGETAPVVLELMQSPEGASVQAQVAAVFEAIADGRKTPTQHEKAGKLDYQVLMQELSKLGWKENDLKVFANPQALSHEPPERVCQMVQDWFTAHLAVSDKATQERLLVETLKPVFSS